MKSFFKKLKAFFKKGTSPRELAITVTLALIFGVFPVLGITTWLLTFIALRFHLNLALMISLSYLAWPLQVILIIPFLRFGEWLFEQPAFPLSLEKIEAVFETSFFNGISELWDANLVAAGGWLAVVLPTGFILYYLLVPFFSYMLKKYKKVEA